MATFLQNIAPAISDVGTGYLKGEASTQEKYRQEELTRQKDALTTYMKLIESGHWKAVDPEKGASSSGVMSIGGIGWLEPVEIPAWEKAKYEQETAERELRLKTAQVGLTSHEATLKAQEADRLRQLELHGITRDTALAHLATAKEGTKKAAEKATEDKGAEFTDMATGVTTTLTKEEYDKIMTSPPATLTKEQQQIRNANDKGTLVKGKPTTISSKLPSELQIDRYSLDAQKRREQLMKDASASGVSEAGGVEIASQLNNMSIDVSSRYHVWQPYKIQKGGKLVAFELPMGKDRTGKPMQLTMGIVRQKAKEQGVSVDTVLDAIQQAMGRK